MVVNEQYKNQHGTVVTIESIRGDKIYFVAEDKVGSDVLRQHAVAKTSDFTNRFPIKVK